MSRMLVRLLALGATIAALFLAAGAGAAPMTYSSQNINVPVLDGSTAASSIPVNETGLVTDVNVSVLVKEGLGGNLSDLDLALVGPDNTRVNLALDKGGVDGNYGSGTDCNGPMTTFDDEALTPISTATPNNGLSFDGPFQPAQGLVAFDGKAANGTWRLEIADTSAGGNQASLLCWKIVVTFPSSDLQVSLTESDDPSFVNADLTYTATVQNAGPDTSGPSTLKLTIPSGVTLKSLASSATGAVCTQAEAKCDLGPIANGATATVTAVVTPVTPGSIEVKAELTPTDSVPENNSATATTQITDGTTGGTETVTVTTKGAGRGVVTSDPAGISCGLTCLTSFVKGIKVTLTTEAAIGSVFKGWGGVCAAFEPDAPCTFTADGDLEVIATFAKTSGGTGESGGSSGEAGSGSTTGSKFFACTIIGTAKADVLRGTKKRDVICGLGGNDKIYGLGGNDVLIGGPGKDLLYGGAGKDEFYARDSSADTIYGGAGKDTVSLDLKDSFFDIESFAL